MKYSGSCHCGNVRFEVEGELKSAMECNAYGTDPKGNEMAAVNIRCLDDIDLAKVPVRQFDGRSM